MPFQSRISAIVCYVTSSRCLWHHQVQTLFSFQTKLANLTFNLPPSLSQYIHVHVYLTSVFLNRPQSLSLWLLTFHFYLLGGLLLLFGLTRVYCAVSWSLASFLKSYPYPPSGVAPATQVTLIWTIFSGLGCELLESWSYFLVNQILSFCQFKNHRLWAPRTAAYPRGLWKISGFSVNIWRMALSK